MATKVLLVEDVEALGRSGEIVNVKPGYARNFLLPQGLAVVTSERTLRMQQQLQEARAQKALVDRKESEDLATRIEGLTLTKVVKVDQEGHMYGSVTAGDIHHLLQSELNVELEKRSIQLKHPIKTTGIHIISVKLKEGVAARFNLKVMTEEGFETAHESAPQESNKTTE